MPGRNGVFTSARPLIGRDVCPRLLSTLSFSSSRSRFSLRAVAELCSFVSLLSFSSARGEATALKRTLRGEAERPAAEIQAKSTNLSQRTWKRRTHNKNSRERRVKANQKRRKHPNTFAVAPRNRRCSLHHRFHHLKQTINSQTNNCIAIRTVFAERRAT